MHLQLLWCHEQSPCHLPDETLVRRIFLIRGEKVMLDRDLAALYGVETKYLKRQVKRNSERFPEDFIFELTKEEFEEWRSQNGTSNAGDGMGLHYAPYAFTEQGVAQLSTVLSSPRAIAVNIQIIRQFTRMRKTLVNHKDLLIQLERLRHTSKEHTGKIAVIFKYLKQMEERQQETELLEEIRRRNPKNPIGFKAAKGRRDRK